MNYIYLFTSTLQHTEPNPWAPTGETPSHTSVDDFRLVDNAMTKAALIGLLIDDPEWP